MVFLKSNLKGELNSNTAIVYRDIILSKPLSKDEKKPITGFTPLPKGFYADALPNRKNHSTLQSRMLSKI